MVASLEAETAAAEPLAHCVWGLWAQAVLPAGQGAFSHVEYAERRLEAFEEALAFI